MNTEPGEEFSAEFDDEPPINVNASQRLQEILRASRESYRMYGGIPAEEVRRKIREWEAEERAVADQLE